MLMFHPHTNNNLLQKKFRVQITKLTAMAKIHTQFDYLMLTVFPNTQLALLCLSLFTSITGKVLSIPTFFIKLQKLSNNMMNKNQSVNYKTFVCFMSSFIFFKILFTHQRHRGRNMGRTRSRLPAGNPIWDSIPRPRDHDLSRRLALNH